MLSTIRKTLLSLGLVLLITGCNDRPQTFSALLEKLPSLPDADHQAIVAEFTARQKIFPLIEKDSVYFLIQSSADDIPYLTGDMCFWRPDSLPMVRIAATDFYYYAMHLPDDARLEYKFVIGQRYLNDPLNPYKDGGGYGENSVLMMPAYQFPKAALFKKEQAISRLDTLAFNSKILNNSRQVFVYKPSVDQEIQTLIFFHDGADYLQYGKAQIILDNLISTGYIPAVYGVFVNPVERGREYRLNDDYLRMLFRELLPELKRRYRLPADLRMGMGGVSLGGLITLYALKDFGRQLDFVFSQSAALQVDDYIVLKKLAGLKNPATRVYLHFGSFEGLEEGHRLLSELFEQAGMAYTLKEVHEGHNWGHWRAYLSEALHYGLNTHGKVQ